MGVWSIYLLYTTFLLITVKLISTVILGMGNITEHVNITPTTSKMRAVEAVQPIIIITLMFPETFGREQLMKEVDRQLQGDLRSVDIVDKSE